MKKTIYIIAGVFILIIILANVPKIMAYANLYSFDKNKEVTTEERVVSFDEISETLHQQRKLAQELEGTRKYSLIGDEVRKGLDEAIEHQMFLDNHPQVNSIKVKVPITTYKDDNKTIEFISGEGEVLEILENGQWKKFNGS
ncbi:hypothetical protein [Bacillus sp. SG-1]|uniref:hypothetical protein n=1 Tax=Bacillus sp. SG-1 TaxID=161544 RepID=UPI0002DDBE4B|nr:hypothetical protein [Bacillus sp. SG-1]